MPEGVDHMMKDLTLLSLHILPLTRNCQEIQILQHDCHGFHVGTARHALRVTRTATKVDLAAAIRD